MDPIIRWGIETHLHLIEEVACGSEASGTGAPDMEEAAERVVRSLGTDWKANEEAAVDRMRAEVTTWWQDFPERQLLTDLYRRAARRKAECGSAEVGASRLMMRACGLPADCWPTSRTRALGTTSGSTRPCRQSWQRCCCHPSEYSPATRCERTSSSPFDPGSSSMLSGASAGNWTDGTRPSPQCSPGGGRRLPSGTDGFPPESVARPVAQSSRITSGVTSRFS